MATYYTYPNNGVVAVVTQEVYEKLSERQELYSECEKKHLPHPELPPVLPVFTFTDPNHHSFQFMTGSLDLMRRLLDGHRVVRSGIWVPFSNGIELGYHGDGRESAMWELQFRTSLDQAIEAFGLGIQVPISS